MSVKSIYILENGASSFIKQIEHDENNKLTVQFLNDKSYTYFDVPLEVYRDMVLAESKGKFLHEHLKDKYKGEQVNT